MKEAFSVYVFLYLYFKRINRSCLLWIYRDSVLKICRFIVEASLLHFFRWYGQSTSHRNDCKK